MASSSRDLADYHAMVAADIENYTGNSDDKVRVLADWLPQVLREAFARSDLDFSQIKISSQAGDGYVAGVDYHKLPRLINPLLGQLQEVLAERNAKANRHDPRMRLRVSVHIGPLPTEADAGRSDGTVMNEVHRLLDAEQSRAALVDSDPDATFVAAVISQRAYEDAIVSKACGLPPSMFAPIQVRVKQFTGDAWLYVPQASGAARHRVGANSTNPRTGGSPERAPGPGHSDSMAPGGAPTSVFHIGTAGQVANSVPGPVTIHQTIPDSDRHPKP